MTNNISYVYDEANQPSLSLAARKILFAHETSQILKLHVMVPHEIYGLKHFLLLLS